jgi:hypothetical protein
LLNGLLMCSCVCVSNAVQHYALLQDSITAFSLAACAHTPPQKPGQAAQTVRCKKPQTQASHSQLCNSHNSYKSCQHSRHLVSTTCCPPTKSAQNHKQHVLPPYVCGGDEAMHVKVLRSLLPCFSKGCGRRSAGLPWEEEMAVDALGGREGKRGKGRATATLSPVNMRKYNSYRRVTITTSTTQSGRSQQKSRCAVARPRRLCPAGLFHQGTQPAASICHTPIAYNTAARSVRFRYAQHVGCVCRKPMYTFIHWVNPCSVTLQNSCTRHLAFAAIAPVKKSINQSKTCQLTAAVASPARGSVSARSLPPLVHSTVP